MRPLVILGATGSIGTQTLNVAGRLGISVVALAARRASPLLMQLAADHPRAAVAIAAPSGSEQGELRDALGARVDFGPAAVLGAAATPGTTVVNGIVGAAGLAPSVAALQAGNRLALANKETLVAGGDVVRRILDEGNGELVPVDSEHSALAQCLVGEDSAAVRRIILTASGGPFRGRSSRELETVTVEEALAHPTWSMGHRITIDSATLMNKALEVVEAHHLFGLGYDRIDVVVHPESIVHSLVEFVDGSVKAQIGDPDMRVPIQYALTFPGRATGDVRRWQPPPALHFEAPDFTTFPALELGYRAGREGGSSGAVLNAADEIAVQAFLERRIGFTAIPVVVEKSLDDVEHRPVTSVDDVLAADAEARSAAHSAIGHSC